MPTNLANKAVALLIISLFALAGYRWWQTRGAAPASPTSSADPNQAMLSEADVMYFDEIDASMSATTYLEKSAQFPITSPVPPGTQVITQALTSGQLFRINVPVTSLPEQNRLNVPGVTGVQLLSDDYEIWIIHLLNVAATQDSAEAFCAAFTDPQAITAQYADQAQVISAEPLDLGLGQAITLQVEAQGETEHRTMRCIPDGTDTAWIVDSFWSAESLSGNYANGKDLDVLKSFVFTPAQ